MRHECLLPDQEFGHIWTGSRIGGGRPPKSQPPPPPGLGGGSPQGSEAAFAFPPQIDLQPPPPPPLDLGGRSLEGSELAFDLALEVDLQPAVLRSLEPQRDLVRVGDPERDREAEALPARSARPGVRASVAALVQARALVVG